MNMVLNDLNANSRRLGDEHYRAMTDWVLSKAPAYSQPRCRKLANDYKASLDELIQTLESMPPAKEVDKSLQFARVFRTLIIRDIQLIDSY